MAEYESLLALARQHGQGHIFAFWPELDADQQRQLLADVSAIDFALLQSLRAKSNDAATGAGDLAAPDMLPAVPAGDAAKAEYAAARDLGRERIAAGRVAVMTVAGGQGTRLGFDGPKGKFPISPVRNKPLFQLFAESILGTSRRYGCTVRWYVMTSPVNHDDTTAFFDKHAYFGLDRDQVFFFQQGTMPAVDTDGKLLMAERHRLALSPDGHGGSIRALAASGALADMARRGIDTISYFQIDNPLVHALDAQLIGLHCARRSELSSMTIPKASDDERVGVFALADGKLKVIEYSDMPAELSSARTADGKRLFDAANIAVHVFDRAFIERLTGPASDLTLPWHLARKAVPHIAVATGRRIHPDHPNAVKFEMFVFDALPLAGNPLLLAADRAEVFSPVKNAEGNDSPATTRRDMIRRAARWLEAAGATVPRDAQGEPDCVLEISPLLADSADELAGALSKLPAIVRRASTYIE